MDSKMNPYDVVFFLGAGSSVKAGVPDTFKFVKDFEDSLTNDENKQLVRKIVDILQTWRQSSIDVELLLDTLTKLDAKEQEPLLRFYEGGEFVLRDYNAKRPVINDLKDFIKKKAIVVDQDKIGYLDPLLGFVEQLRPLSIFSVNYDTCIEQFCNVHRLEYQDGFDINWNPRVFERENADIMLYKLHGSIIWYRSDRAGYMKLPIMTDEASIRLITGERAESLMLYPMQKLGYEEPMLDLLTRFRNALHDCRVLVVVGYSFRDAHLQRIVLDAARSNPDLTIVLVDPKAGHIYEDRLKYFDQYSHVHSSLDGRVVCLPYKFEDVLPLLKNHYLYHLKIGLDLFSKCTSNQRLGVKTNWLECLQPLLNAEHTEKVESLLRGGKIGSSEIGEQWQINVEMNLKLALNLYANEKSAKAKPFLAMLKQVLYTLLHDKLGVEPARIGGGKIGIIFMFGHLIREGSSSQISPSTFELFLKEQYEYILTRSSMCTDSSIKMEFAFLATIIEYLGSFHAGRIPFDEYTSMRRSLIGDADSLHNIMMAWDRDNDPRFIEELLAIERHKIETLLTWSNG